MARGRVSWLARYRLMTWTIWRDVVAIGLLPSIPRADWRRDRSEKQARFALISRCPARCWRAGGHGCSAASVGVQQTRGQTLHGLPSISQRLCKAVELGCSIVGRRLARDQHRAPFSFSRKQREAPVAEHAGWPAR